MIAELTSSLFALVIIVDVSAENFGSRKSDLAFDLAALIPAW